MPQCPRRQSPRPLKAVSKPTLYIAVDLTNGVIKTHVPKGLEIDIEILELDEPDAPGLKHRGIEHPASTSDRLECDSDYETEIHYGQ